MSTGRVVTMPTAEYTDSCLLFLPLLDEILLSKCHAVCIDTRGGALHLTLILFYFILHFSLIDM